MAEGGGTMTALCLFSGIGGLDLGLERAGFTIAGQVEIDPWCRKVLAKHWPEVPRHDDVRTAAGWWRGVARPSVDLVAGGFPCQDISNAHTNGIRTALAGAKSGLWDHFAAIVAILEPRWVIAENVAAWRRWVPGVRADLARLGYASVPVEVPAGSRGAPHPRPRVFVVAHAHGEGEPLRALHAQVAGLRPVPEARGDWREPFAGPVRVDDGLPGRMDRLRGLGNAVVPQVAEHVGRLILAAREVASW
jgi:DNA (cytosine-5)-methyltransferase 1